MARIRSIKPEFPQSESMGRVSRDARLLFVLLWTICDDSGRTRAASRMLASLLFPYDDDAAGLIDGWLTELEDEKCIVRYTVDGSTYLEICKWCKHQKIDKPSPSRLPAIREDSREVASPREDSSEDLGSRTVGSRNRTPAAAAAVVAHEPPAGSDGARHKIQGFNRTRIQRAVDRADPLEIIAAFGGARDEQRDAEWTRDAAGMVIGELVAVLWRAQQNRRAVRQPSGLRAQREDWDDQPLESRRGWIREAFADLGIPMPAPRTQDPPQDPPQEPAA